MWCSCKEVFYFNRVFVIGDRYCKNIECRIWCIELCVFIVLYWFVKLWGFFLVKNIFFDWV